MPALNQLTNILSQKLTMNKARIACLGIIIIGIITSQTSNLKKIARHSMNGKSIDTNYRRLQRFFAQVEIDYEQIAKLIYQLFDLDKVIISIDRTNWKWGKRNINIFMLAVVYKGIAIPLYWSMLDKRGNSNTLERTELIEKFITSFGKDKIQSILADREFIGKQWLTWLDKQNIKFTIRIKKNSKVLNRYGEQIQVKYLFRNLAVHETYRHGRIVTIDGCLVRLFATKSSEGELVIVATNDVNICDAMSLYARRWEIETLFSCFKGRGFNLEDTHLTHLDRVSKLVAVCALAFCWAYHVGIVVDKTKPNKRKPKSHGRPQQSLFALGLDTLINGLHLFLYSRKSSVFNKLVRYLSPQPKPLCGLGGFCRVQRKINYKTKP